MSPSMRTAILWLHAVGGIAWVGAAAVFVIAAGATGIEEDDGRAMVRGIAPIINRIGLGAMLFIVASGVVNIYIAGTMRRFVFSNTFTALLAIKIAILAAMYGVLAQSFRAERMLLAPDPSNAAHAARRLIVANAAIVGCGAAALLIGLWLLGA